MIPWVCHTILGLRRQLAREFLRLCIQRLYSRILNVQIPVVCSLLDQNTIDGRHFIFDKVTECCQLTISSDDLSRVFVGLRRFEISRPELINTFMLRLLIKLNSPMVNDFREFLDRFINVPHIFYVLLGRQLRKNLVRRLFGLWLMSAMHLDLNFYSFRLVIIFAPSRHRPLFQMRIRKLWFPPLFTMLPNLEGRDITVHLYIVCVVILKLLR